MVKETRDDQVLRRGRYQHRFSVTFFHQVRGDDPKTETEYVDAVNGIQARSWARREARKRKLDLVHVSITAVY